MPRSLLQLCALGAIASLTACPCKHSPPVPPEAEATASYITAKRQYVEVLQKAMVPDGPNVVYRLVAVTGPQWRVGEALDIDNPLNVITNKCLVPADKLPSTPIPWTSYPGYTSSKRVNFAAGLPEKVLKFLGSDNQANAKFDLSRTGEFSLSDLQALILPQDDFEASFSNACKDILSLRGALVVRGIVSGKETFKSGQVVDAGVDVKVVQDELLKLSYNDKGDFVLEDKALTPKIFMVAYFPKQDRGSAVDRRAPTPEEIERLEALSLK